MPEPYTDAELNALRGAYGPRKLSDGSTSVVLPSHREIDRLLATVDALEARRCASELEADILARENTDLRRALQATQAERDALRKSRDKYVLLLHNAESERDELKQHADALKAKSDRQAQNIQSLYKQRNEAKAERDRLRERLEWALKCRPPRTGIEHFEREIRAALEGE